VTQKWDKYGFFSFKNSLNMLFIYKDFGETRTHFSNPKTLEGINKVFVGINFMRVSPICKQMYLKALT